MPFATPAFAGQFRNRSLIALGFLVFGAVLAYAVAGYILNDDLTSLTLVAVAFLVGAFVVVTLNNWRNGVYFFLSWLLFEDLARKFVGNNMAVYFVKDALVAIVYLSFFVACRRKAVDTQTFRPPFRTALLLFIWFGFIQMFNPGSPSILYGILGMKVNFLYVPLLIVGYSVVNSEVELRRFFHINLGLMLVIAVLGIIQSILGHTFLNPAVPAEDIRLLSQLYREAPLSGVVVYRPTSVFVSTGRFSDMLIVGWLIVFGFSGYLLLRHRRGRIFAFLALAVMAAACVLCASRGVFLWTLGSSLFGGAAFLWGAPWRRGQVRQVLRTLQRAMLGVALAMMVLLLTYPDALMNRLAVYSETLDPRSPASELFTRVGAYPMSNFVSAFYDSRWPYGYGIGTTTLGIQYLTRIFHVPSIGTAVESGFGNLIIEMGIVGLALWFVMSVAVVVSAWRVVRKLKGSPWFPLAFMIFWYAFLLLLPLTYEGSQPYQDFVMNAYVWLLLGILFRLPKLALSSDFAATAPARQPARRWIP
jgi:hypothetical protein